MRKIPLSDTLAQWVTMPKCRLIERHDHLVITEGEVSDHLYYSEGIYKVTRSSRNDPERFEMSTTNYNDLEHYLTFKYGEYIRSGQYLPSIVSSSKVEDLKPGWRVEFVQSSELVLQDPEGNRRGVYDPLNTPHLEQGWRLVTPLMKNWLLYDPAGTPRVLLGSHKAVHFSWIADEPLELLRASYLDPAGMPLFPTGWIGPRGSEPEYVTRKWTEYIESISASKS